LASQDETVERRTMAGLAPKGSHLAALNAAAVVVAALYLGRELIVPLVLAVLLAFVLAPLVTALERVRLGLVPSVLLTVAVAFAVIGAIGYVIGDQATALSHDLPTYGAAIRDKLRGLPLGAGLASQLDTAMTGGPDRADASSTLGIVRSVGQVLLGPLSTAAVVALFAIVVLLARDDLRDRLVRLMGRQDLHRTILAMNEAARRLSRFYLLQLSVNAGFGLFVGVGLWQLGLPNFVLWGVLAGLMRFVPFIGSFVAGVPPVLLALAVSPGWSLALGVLLLFVISDMILGQVVEPLLYGHNTGLSPVAVVLSTAFWAFLWGPVGLLIATPLTVCLVVIGRHVPQLAFVDVALGSGPPLAPQETFYQRALEGDARELRAQALRVVGLASQVEYYDQVALRGLALMQADLARDAVTFERLEAIHAMVEMLLSGLAPAIAPRAMAWSEPGAILCLPARGPLDDLAATMAAQLLAAEGFGAATAANQVLSPGQGAALDLGAVRMCCLSVMQAGSSASAIRYLTRRIQKQMPGAAIVVGLWHADRDSTLLAELRLQDDQETIIASLGELLALTRAISARKPVKASP